MKVITNDRPEPSGVTVVNGGVRLRGGYAGWPDGVAVATSEDGRWEYHVTMRGGKSPSVKKVQVKS